MRTRGRPDRAARRTRPGRRRGAPARRRRDMIRPPNLVGAWARRAAGEGVASRQGLQDARAGGRVGPPEAKSPSLSSYRVVGGTLSDPTQCLGQQPITESAYPDGDFLKSAPESAVRWWR